MAEAEVWEQVESEDGPGDLVVQISGVGLEVEKVRTEMARLETRLSDRIGKEVGKVRTDLSARIGEEVGRVRTDLSARIDGLSDRIDGMEKSVRAWMGIGFSFIAVLVVLMSALG